MTREERLNEVIRKTKFELGEGGSYLDDEGENILWACDELTKAWKELAEISSVHCHHQWQSDARGEQIERMWVRDKKMVEVLENIARMSGRLDLVDINWFHEHVYEPARRCFSELKESE